MAVAREAEPISSLREVKEAGLDLPVLGWTVPAAVAEVLNRELGTGFVGHRPAEIDIELPVDRSKQTDACAAHVSKPSPPACSGGAWNCSAAPSICAAC